MNGTTVTFPGGALEPGDLAKCARGGGAYVPNPGHGVGSSAGITVTAHSDGSVTVQCALIPKGVTPSQ